MKVEAGPSSVLIWARAPVSAPNLILTLFMIALGQRFSGSASSALSLPFSSVFRTGNWEGCIQNEQLKDTYEFHFGAFTLKMGLENSCLKFLFCLGPTSVNQKVILMILIDFVATGVLITSMHSGADLQPSNVQVTPLHPAGACCQPICTVSKCFKDALLMGGGTIHKGVKMQNFPLE